MPELKCWNCGALLNDIPRPISRHANCPDCFNELHCCRLCVHFDASLAAGQCDEERADPPVIKEGANFCEWFAPNETAYRPDVTTKRRVATARLEALFGRDATQPELEPDAATDSPESASLSEQDEARAKLDRLFSANDPVSED